MMVMSMHNCFLMFLTNTTGMTLHEVKYYRRMSASIQQRGDADKINTVSSHCLVKCLRFDARRYSISQMKDVYLTSLLISQRIYTSCFQMVDTKTRNNISTPSGSLTSTSVSTLGQSGCHESTMLEDLPVSIWQNAPHPPQIPVVSVVSSDA